jgi:hypothetical protein
VDRARAEVPLAEFSGRAVDAGEKGLSGDILKRASPSCGMARVTADPRHPPGWRSPSLPITIGISSCLLGEEVRFDGGHKKEDLHRGWDALAGRQRVHHSFPGGCLPELVVMRLRVLVAAVGIRVFARVVIGVSPAG